MYNTYIYLFILFSHLKALSSITDTPLDHHLGKTYLGDAISIVICGSTGVPVINNNHNNNGSLS